MARRAFITYFGGRFEAAASTAALISDGLVATLPGCSICIHPVSETVHDHRRGNLLGIAGQPSLTDEDRRNHVGSMSGVTLAASTKLARPYCRARFTSSADVVRRLATDIATTPPRLLARRFVVSTCLEITGAASSMTCLQGGY